MKHEKRGRSAVLLFLLAAAVAGLFIFTSAAEIAFFLCVLLLFVFLYVAIIRQGRRSEQVVRINEERFQVTLSHISEIIFDNVLEADVTTDVLLGANAKNLTRLLEIDENSSYTGTIAAISNKLVREEFSADYRRTLSRENILDYYARGETALEYECVERSDGENYGWIRIHICIFFSQVTKTVRIISYVKNIDQERKKLDSLMEKAERDPLTGLYNRLSTIETTQNILSNGSGGLHAVFMLDVDNFKQVNDTYGHMTGDRVLLSIAGMLKALFQSSDIVGRFGGDEFLVFMADLPDRAAAAEKGREICRSVKKLALGPVLEQQVTLSIGIAMAESGGALDFNELYHRADMALYEAKEQGRDCFCIYNAPDVGDIVS